MKGLFIPILVVVLFKPQAFPQNTNNLSPENTATKYINALTLKDWDSVANLMHPEALKAIRNLIELIPFDETSESILMQMFGTKSKQETIKLTDHELYAGFMSYVDDVRKISETMHYGRTEVLGNVYEGEDTCHVFYRFETYIKSLPYKSTGVISMAKTHVGWGILLQADLGLIIESWKQKLEDELYE